MAGKGAAGLTARQIAETLHLEGPAAFNDVGRLQRSLVRDQAAIGEGKPDAPTLNMANGLFLQAGFPIRPSYLSGLQRNFGAAPELADFIGDPAGSMAAINAWVSARTDGLIPELFGSPLSELTRLVLLNAVYLDADWLHAFDPNKTSTAPFHAPTGPTRADFMHQTTSLRYGAGRGYQAVDLPYRSSTLSLLVVLPNGKDPAAFERRLTARSLARIVAGQSLQPVELSLPRFHLNTHIELNKTLASLGMPLAFSATANFSRINGTRRLKIGEVVHEADLEVDEKGTVAAAATGVVIQRVSRARGLVRFNANRPFLFFLRDRRTGTVLFAGRLTNPATANG